jgi:hypothetical protein
MGNFADTDGSNHIYPLRLSHFGSQVFGYEIYTITLPDPDQKNGLGRFTKAELHLN